MKKEEEQPINYTKKAFESLALIGKKEPEFLVAVAELLNHLAGTYQDKYEAVKEIMDTKAQLYHPRRGAVINSYQISKYNQRFMSEGFVKSGNKNDMLKIAHYALFDVVRMNRMTGVKNVDVVDGKAEEITQKEYDEIPTSEAQ